MSMRTESDCLGELQLPSEVYYGVQTERARLNFAARCATTDEFPTYISAVASIKKAAALTHKDLGVLDEFVATAIVQAADEIMSGKLQGQFPLCMLQGGGGTSTNMNVNEVIANRANEILTGRKGYEKVNPNDHVNMGQSTNDVIPSAVKLCTWQSLEELRVELTKFCKALRAKEEQFAEVVKLGRTCLQDALPVTLGQEFSGYRCLMERRNEKLAGIQPEYLDLPMGATAVGTGAGSFAGYIEGIAAHLSQITGLAIQSEENFFDGLQNGDAYLDAMQAIKSIAVAASKIATDLRIFSSGPRAGFNEIRLPAVQPGSSIMPGKINPVMPELINQICYQICGNELAVSMAVEGGELDLNVWEPVVVRNICESAALMTDGLKLFREKCIAGIEANEEVCRTYAQESLALSSIISALFDYKTGTKVSEKAFAEGKNIKQVTVELGLLSEDDANLILDPLLLTNKEKMAELMSSFKDRLHPNCP